MSNKKFNMTSAQLIKAARQWAETVTDSFPKALLTQMADALEEHEHEPKPDIRKGEVYAHRNKFYTECYRKSTENIPVLAHQNHERRKLTLAEMPQWVEEMVREKGIEDEDWSMKA